MTKRREVNFILASFVFFDGVSIIFIAKFGDFDYKSSEVKINLLILINENLVFV
jgi:hypothetical protein